MIIGRAQILLSGRNLRCIGISISSRTLQSSHQTFKLCVNGGIVANRRAQCFATLTRKPINLAKETVDKNILIYRNDRLRFFRILGIFALAQVGFWSYMTFNAYTTMTDSRNFEMVKYGPEGAPPEKKNWASLTGIRMKLHSGIWRYVVTSICFVVGWYYLNFVTFYHSLLYRLYNPGHHNSGPILHGGNEGDCLGAL